MSPARKFSNFAAIPRISDAASAHRAARRNWKCNVRTCSSQSFSPDPAPDPLFVRFVRGWIWLCALAGLAGWSLSALGQLNRTGYVVFFAAVAGIMFALRRRWGWGRPGWGRLLRRFRHPLPAAFAVLALLVLIGGAIYPPTNYTGLNYHLARVLQWLAHGQWCWIHTANTRMNFSGCAFEWLTTPLVLFTQSDRALFLVNFIPLLLLPGLIFSAFARLGVRARGPGIGCGSCPPVTISCSKRAALTTTSLPPFSPWRRLILAAAPGPPAASVIYGLRRWPSPY